MASLLRHCVTLLRVPGNELAFALRSRVGWSRGEARLPHEDKRGLFDFAPAASRRALQAAAARLEREHGLGDLRACSTRSVHAANLALLECLARLAPGDSAPAGPDGVVRAVDVGSGDFHYATALHRWLAGGAAAGREVVLRGFEVDGFGVYRDGHSRTDHARAHARLAARSAAGRSVVSYEVADFTRLCLPAQDVVVMLFPFLSAHALLRWGLPLSKLRPRRLVSRAVAALRPGGWLVVANQTGAESARLQHLLRSEPVALEARTSWASDLVPDREHTLDRVGSLWRRLDALRQPGGGG
ncbi:MAG TPA: hypothetical protein VFZ65_15700 [Planctomycetota bacterium]|nr:hypothetical protein [Planctomycetota bacterium]